MVPGMVPGVPTPQLLSGVLVGALPPSPLRGRDQSSGVRELRATRNWGAEGEPCFCSPPMPCAVLSPPGLPVLENCPRVLGAGSSAPRGQLRALQVGEGQKDLGTWCRGC